MWMIASLLLIFVASCKKENYDDSKTTLEEIESLQTGGTIECGFFTSIENSPSTLTSGGASTMNSLTKEVLSNGEFQWKLFSTITDGASATNEITFITPTLDAGTYPIEAISYHLTDEEGVVIEEHNWVKAQMPTGRIVVSSLEDSPGVVTGNTGEFRINVVPDSLEHVYYCFFTEVPIN